MPEEIPPNWTTCMLSQCVNVLDHQRIPVNSEARQSRQGIIPYYGATGRVGFIDDYIFDEELVLLGEDGAPFLDKSKSIAYIISGKSWVNNHAHVLRAIKEITSNKFVKYFLDQFDFTGYVNGTTRLKLTQGKMNDIPVNLSPRNEQRRIVAKLEKLLHKVDACKERLDKIPSILKRFRQSVLAAACSGRLTADWREKNPDVDPAAELLNSVLKKTKQTLIFKPTTSIINIPDNWICIKIAPFIERIEAGKNFSCPETSVTEKTVGVVKISAVTWDKFDYRETKTVVDQSKINPKLFIKAEDLLISRANTIELVGASVVVEEIGYRIMISDKIWRVSLYELEKKYANYYFKSAYGRKEIESKATGNQASMRNISQKAFRDIKMLIPPLSEQQEIVRRVESLFKKADEIEARYQKAKAFVDKLTQSILAKAFRGELVPQEPNDEPASALLKRIAEERTKVETKRVAKQNVFKKSNKRGRG